MASMRALVLAAFVIAAAAFAGSASADAGPGHLYITVLQVNFSAYPATADNYINATFKMLKAANATGKLLFPNLPPAASMKFSKVAGVTALVTVSLIDPTGDYIKQLITNLTNVQVAVFVRDAELTYSGGRVKIQTDGPNNLPSGGHTFYCVGDGPYAVGILCPASASTRPPRPPPSPKSPPKPPRSSPSRRRL